MYVAARKVGRCFNGAHRDAGTIIHLVPERTANGDWFLKALCGTTPGRRGNGWTESEHLATCKKCLAKQEKNNSKQADKQ